MRLRVKKTISFLVVLALSTYLVLAMTTLNSPKEIHPTCEQVSINIMDESTNGFLSASEIKRILQRKGLYPLNKEMSGINPRDIEDLLKVSPFVSTAECYKTKDGCVDISITQRLPIIRIKNNSGQDYYVDDHGGIMPNSNYTSDLIIATGNINQWFARNYITCLAIAIMKDEFWRNQIEQINVLPDLGIELVPRVGEHIIYLGKLPQTNHQDERMKLVSDFVNNKLDKLAKFYKYGLSKAGWNKYSYINMEFDNQIICKKKDGKLK